VNTLRKEKCELAEGIKSENESEVLRGKECEKRWKNHFQSLLNSKGNRRNEGVEAEVVQNK